MFVRQQLLNEIIYSCDSPECKLYNQIVAQDRKDIHMDDQKILAILNEFEPAEEAYRKLYLANPYDKIPPVRDWQDFVTEYRQNMKSPVEIPTEPISDISTYFYEGKSYRLCACREYFYRFSLIIIQSYLVFAAVIYLNLDTYPASYLFSIVIKMKTIIGFGINLSL